MDWKSIIVIDYKSIQWKRIVILKVMCGWWVVIGERHPPIEAIGMVMGITWECVDEMLCAWVQNHMKIVGSALQLDEELEMEPRMVLDEGGDNHYVVE